MVGGIREIAVVGNCPVCNQGRLLVARLKGSINDYIIVCEECESHWWKIDDIHSTDLSNWENHIAYEYVEPKELTGHSLAKHLQAGIL